MPISCMLNENRKCTSRTLINLDGFVVKYISCLKAVIISIVKLYTNANNFSWGYLLVKSISIFSVQ